MESLLSCGQSFSVRLAPTRPTSTPAILFFSIFGSAMVFGCLLSVIQFGRVEMVPIGFVTVLAAKCVMSIPVTSKSPSTILVGLRTISFGHVLLELARVSCHLVGTKLVLGGHTLDLSSLEPDVRSNLVRHIEARARLARGPVRTRAVAIALEAMFVSGAPAVLLYKRRPIRVMSTEEVRTHRLLPKQRIYVAAELTPEVGTPYRSMSRGPETIPVGVL